MVVRTLGHGSRSPEAFLRLLRRHDIRRLADVRRYPVSRRFPFYTRDSLETALPGAGVAYRHVEGLGGRRPTRPESPHRALGEDLRGYADHMESPAFVAAIAQLLEWGREAPVAVLCAETDPAHCHRSLLADALCVRGVTVIHILSEEETRAHVLTPWGRADGERVVYDVGCLPFETPPYET